MSGDVDRHDEHLGGSIVPALQARIADLEVAALNLIEAYGSLAMRNEASMSVWRDKLTPDMLAGMDEDRASGFAAVQRLKALGLGLRPMKSGSSRCSGNAAKVDSEAT